jgi:ligand-binding sensor domain-containing protein/serine phosphatase RsbU (regulator of sigma subunit)
MRQLHYFVLLVFALVVQPLASQIKISKVKLFSVTEGLSQSKVNTIYQDSRGLLWIGTEDGLNRYDGYEFYTYANQPYDTNTISNNYINAICEDSNGLLWIATNKGLNSLNLKTGQFTIYLNDSRKSNTISDNVVLNVFVDKDKTLWVKTMKSLDKFDYETHTFQRFNHYYNVFNNVFTNICFPLMEDKSGNFWVGSKDGLNIFDRDLHLFNRFLALDYSEESLSSDEIHSMCTDHAGNMWIGTSKGLDLFNPEKKNFRRFYPDPINMLSPRNIINALFPEKDGKIWIGTLGGLEIFDTKSQQFIEPAAVNYTFNIPVYAITRDMSGLLWVGTSKGLLKLNTQKNKFKSIAAPDNDIKLSGYDIGCIYPVDNNSILIGTKGSGLNYLDYKNKRVTIYDLRVKGDMSQNIIHCIFRNNASEYFLGTESGIVLFNPITGKFVNLGYSGNIDGSDMLLQNRVNAITRDEFANFWIGTNSGLFYFDTEQLKIIGYFNNVDDEKSLVNNKVNTLYYDKKKRLWIGTEDGLDVYDTKNNYFNHMVKNKQGKSLFSSNSINCIAADNKGFLWIGTNSGLNKLKLADSSTVIFTAREGLSDNTIYAIQIDQNQHIWVSTNKGINHIDPKTNKIKSFDVHDGLQDYEFNLNCVAKNDLNEIFFGGVSGINYFNADQLSKNNFKPNIVITSVEMITKNGKVSFQNYSKDRINIPFGTHVFTINFAALDFTLPEKNNYAYKFYSDSEEDWINIGEKHSATFSNLKPGEYTFKVKGSNNDGVWNDEGIVLKFYIEAPFWLKPQAYYVYSFFFLIILLAFYRFRTFNLRESNRILKEREITSLEIERQREQLALKNRNITDSINYAKRIQEALMPSEKSFRRIIPDSFIFHQPKDIVSGDFFWVSERGDKIFVAAVDCTGHGVPGAFMSLIGFELFRKITHTQGIENPSQILTILNREFEEIFNDVEDYVMRDGMDIAFCVIDKKTMVLEYSGAVNPIYLIRDNKITEIAGSRFSVGLDDTPEQTQIFENKQIVLNEDDVIYLFSDGYADQFGGPEGKKFKYRRFRHLLLTIHQYPMNEQHNLLHERVNRWKGEYEQVDDILVIGFRPVFNKSVHGAV